MSTKLPRRDFQRALASLIVTGSAVPPAKSQSVEKSPGRAPRLFYNNDGSFLLYRSPPLSKEEFVYEAVGRLVGTQVDAVVCHMFGYGDAVPLYPTSVPDAAGIARAKADHA